MELKRDIYEKLLDWKKRDSHTPGAWGHGRLEKTYILNKFAQENYKTFLYINMVLQTTGSEFLACLERLLPGSRECRGRNSRFTMPCVSLMAAFGIPGIRSLSLMKSRIQ